MVSDDFKNCFRQFFFSKKAFEMLSFLEKILEPKLAQSFHNARNIFPELKLEASQGVKTHMF
jgi:hypothetical protein